MAVAQGLSGLHKMTIERRRDAIASASGLAAGEVAQALAGAGLDADTAEQFIENVIGTYALPMGAAVHLLINGERRIAPMVVEEPSVVAAASAAAKLVARGGGFRAEAEQPLMIAQVQLYDVADVAVAGAAVLAEREAILAQADATMPGIVRRAGGARELEVRAPGDAMLVVHILIDCCDAMGANVLNTAAEKLGPVIHAIAGGKLGLRILSNLSDRRRVSVSCDVPAEVLAMPGWSGLEVARGVQQASKFAEVDPYRAATHNKGIMNGIDPVVIATGNDWRAVEAGAHAYAARDGKYGPLATWRCVEQGQHARLQGTMQLPLAVGIVGGTLGHHRGAQLALKIAAARSAGDLAMLAACVGLSSNLAALRALSTEGIQRGHTCMHARSVAMTAGASGAQIRMVAQEMSRTGEVNTTAARRILSQMGG
jgi:hydroxymethylglutaryl-CoA reductase